MAILISSLSKFVYFVLLIICINSKNAESETSNFKFINFEQIKYDLFVKTDTISSIKNSSHNFKGTVEKCLTDLKVIQNGLMRDEFWAMKFLDSWGKIPSGLLNGNTHDFGAFSQCLHIERNDEAYETQYCTGRLFFNLLGNSTQKSYRYNINNIIFPDVIQIEDLPDFDKPYFTFGICLPASCPPLVFEPIINDLIPKNGHNVSIKLSEGTCQLRENAYALNTLDKVVLGILGVILFLITLSTGYDIFCTFNKLEKSPILLAFSFYTNGLKLFSCKTNTTSNTMDCIHGIRAISAQWVVLGHVVMCYLMLPIQNRTVHDTFVTQYESMFILSAPIAVETFFVLSGLLVSINLLEHFEKTKGKINVVQFYIHRYVRLTPLLIISILVSVCRFAGNGPLLPNMLSITSNQCKRYWWSTLLYIQNYVNPENLCFGSSWYLSVDTQLYCIAPAIVYLIYRFKAKSLVPLSLLVLACIIITLRVHVMYNLTTLFAPEKMYHAYYPTHIRFSSWLVGVIAGYFFKETQNRTIHIPKRWSYQLVSLSSILATFVKAFIFNLFNTFPEHLDGNGHNENIALFYTLEYFNCLHWNNSTNDLNINHYNSGI
ncbi:nose resistant to fluoxetine protein 6-like [Contarinia nasturtii]|uniref:nose resistant to fluoxetine protein 6-like n=1 Tax=Contarinia nasturtii TaxID=265458 RepID=UPI0012D3ED1A|nr:nose resistant to fluoxetine protein 6-like [Contarinia nasturtii]